MALIDKDQLKEESFTWLASEGDEAFEAGAEWAVVKVKARFLEVLDRWEAHAIRGMRNGATAYHQGKISLITDLRDWINREG